MPEKQITMVQEFLAYKIEKNSTCEGEFDQRVKDYMEEIVVGDLPPMKKATPENDDVSSEKRAWCEFLVKHVAQLRAFRDSHPAPEKE
eukprot:13981092-Heterocapsa_arctica.AAC.2